MKVKLLKELAATVVAVKLILSNIVTPYSYRLAPEMRNYVKNELKHGNFAKKLPAETKPLSAPESGVCVYFCYKLFVNGVCRVKCKICYKIKLMTECYIWYNNSEDNNNSSPVKKHKLQKCKRRFEPPSQLGYLFYLSPVHFCRLS